MVKLKTQRTEDSVSAFLDRVPDEIRRADCRTLLPLFEETVKGSPKMWGPSIVGFGNHHYTYESGRELDWFIVGFSPRKSGMTIYLPGRLDVHAALLERLGKHTTGKGCLSVKRLSDVDLDVLAVLVAACAAELTGSDAYRLADAPVPTAPLMARRS